MVKNLVDTKKWSVFVLKVRTEITYFTPDSLAAQLARFRIRQLSTPCGVMVNKLDLLTIFHEFDLHKAPNTSGFVLN